MKDIWVVSQCIVVFILSYLVNYNKLISLGFFTILSPLHNIITLNISFYIWKYTILRLFDQPQNIIKIPCREIIAHSIYLYFCLLNFIFILDSPSSFHSFLSVYRTCFTHYFVSWQQIVFSFSRGIFFIHPWSLLLLNTQLWV